MGRRRVSGGEGGRGVYEIFTCKQSPHLVCCLFWFNYEIRAFYMRELSYRWSFLKSFSFFFSINKIPHYEAKNFLLNVSKIICFYLLKTSPFWDKAIEKLFSVFIFVIRQPLCNLWSITIIWCQFFIWKTVHYSSFHFGFYDRHSSMRVKQIKLLPQ